MTRTGSPVARALVCVVLQLLLLVPVKLTGTALGKTCSCGMASGHCSCGLMNHGGRGMACHSKAGMDRCSLRPVQPMDPHLAPTGPELRGWLEASSWYGLAFDPTLCGTLSMSVLLPGSSLQPPPDPPPPRGLPSPG